MSVRKFIAIASLVLVASVATPSKASADWLFTPFVGWNWGGTANLLNVSDFDDEFEQKAMFGASLGWMGAGIIGFEVDFGYSPNFFQNTAGSGNFEFGDSNLTTLMGNLDHWRSDRRTERSRLPALRGRWRRASSRAASVAPKISSRSTRRTGASTSAPARCSSSRQGRPARRRPLLPVAAGH